MAKVKLNGSEASPLFHHLTQTEDHLGVCLNKIEDD